MKKTCLGALIVLSVVLLAAPRAEAATVYGTAVDMSYWDDSRSTEGILELVGTGRFDGMEIDWLVTYNMLTGVYSYEYEFDFLVTRQNSISHLILDTSDNCLDSSSARAECLSNVTMNGSTPTTFVWGTEALSPGNPGFPAGSSITGVKIEGFSSSEPNIWTLAFESLRAPMWGDIFLKAGSEDYLYNYGLIDHELYPTIASYLVVPDTTTDIPLPDPIPEPATLTMLGLGLAGLAARARRRTRKQQD